MTHQYNREITLASLQILLEKINYFLPDLLNCVDALTVLKERISEIESEILCDIFYNHSDATTEIIKKGNIVFNYKVTDYNTLINSIKSIENKYYAKTR